MATHDLELVGLLLPGSDSVFPDSSVNYDTNDRYPHEVLAYADTSTKIGASCVFRVPRNYVGTPIFAMLARVPGTSGAVVWDVEYTSIADDGTESGDPSTDQEALSVTLTIPGTALRPKEATVAATGSNFAAGDLVMVTVSRDGSDAADTVGALALLESFVFRYNDA